MPVVLGRIGEKEKRVRVILEKEGDGAALLAERQRIRCQAGVDDAEAAILAGAGEEERILTQGIGDRLRPAAGGEGLIDALVIEFRLEQVFERFEASGVSHLLK